MIEQTVNKVAELYKEKSDLYSELSDILNNENKKFIIGYVNTSSFAIGGSYSFRKISPSFLAEIRVLTENHIKQRIEEIDEELKSL